jgi:hypothetical protein
MLNPRVADQGRRNARALRIGIAAAVLAWTLPGCAMHWPTMHWQWTHRAPVAAQPVSELSVEGDERILQYWNRNALQVDLTGMAGEGSAVLRPTHGWPVRLEFKVQPGSFGQLEVVGSQRAVFDVPVQGKPTVLPLAPGSYALDTPQILIRWSAAAGSER